MSNKTVLNTEVNKNQFVQRLQPQSKELTVAAYSLTMCCTRAALAGAPTQLNWE
jgi:hypothetical protein